LPSLDLALCGPLDFHLPDHASFPCLGLAYRALEAEGSLPTVLNAANEVAVARFLKGRLAFTSIPKVIEQTMDAHEPGQVCSLADVRAVDLWAREYSLGLARGLELKS
jgi:1-deoxy-D-xylulose-5-phosphate reductoisomerase